MTPLQSKMARSAIKWSVEDLATHADVGISTVQEFEKGSNVRKSTIHKITKAILNTGKIEFIGDCGVVCKDGS